MQRGLTGSLLALSLFCTLACGLPHAEAGIFSVYAADNSPWCRLERAGNPQCIAPWASTTYGPKYSGYYVGGGVPVGGVDRCDDEGTWGVDYAPWYSRVRLNWSHRRYQGGQGQYEPNKRATPANRRRSAAID